MKLFEYEAADIFAEYGVRVPERTLASTEDQAVLAADRIGFPVVIKAQVLIGGRGLAGGVKIVSTPEEAHRTASELLGSRVKGIRVRNIMVTRKIDFYKELYFGITVDGYNGKPSVMVGTEGGVNIEEMARKTPQNIHSLKVNIDRDLFTFEARKLLTKSGFPSKQIPSCADVLVRLYKVFVEYDAMVAEINPLVVCSNESLMALDAKLEIDDSSLFRMGKSIPGDHDRNESYLEKRGREIGVTYVELDGDIAIICSGAFRARCVYRNR